MGRPRSVSPPPEFSEDAKLLWRSAVRQLQTQGTWRAVDCPLLESYVQSVERARSARRSGNHDIAAAAERDASARARDLMLTPDTRQHAPANRPPPRIGIIEASSTVA